MLFTRHMAATPKMSYPSRRQVLSHAGLLGQMSRFACVGIAATLTHVIVALAATWAFELAPLAANFLGFCVAVSVSYWGHLRITFRVPNPQRQHLYRFAVLSLGSLAVSSLITATMTALGASITVTMIAVGLIVPVASFIAARLWAFTTINCQAPPKTGDPL